MISFPLSLVLIPYGIVLLLFALLAAYSVHNLVKYGATTNTSFVATFSFLAGAVFVLFFTWQALQGTDWSQEINLSAPFATISSTQL
jgi:L-cystine uptake protein TcyP (sodium:dicarboxylate symporter family)